MFEMPTIQEAAPQFMKKKGYKPTDTVNARAMSMGAPSQFVDEAYLTYLQKIGRKKGGLATMGKGGVMRGIKKLKGIYGEVETSMGRDKGAQFEQIASPLNIIKETGGNWSPSGEMVYKSRLDQELDKLQKHTNYPKSQHLKRMLQDAIARGDAREVAVFTENLRDAIGIEAANNWVKSNLKNYITKQMATKDDPVRKLAEQGITAFPKNVDEYGDLELRNYGSPQARLNRSNTNNVKAGVAQSPLAKHYETMTDESINPTPAKEYQRIQALPKMQRPTGTIDAPWMSKLDPDTPIFSLSRDADFDKLGFTHMMDVLREDVAAGRLRPEKLSTITVEQAVRRAHEYDETLKANMLNARIAEQANANVFKEYPEGYRWVQLDQPGQFTLESDVMGHSVRGYEPPKGHPDYSDISGDSGRSTYGHGGYDAIKSGKAKVYSLRDPKGQSHVTIEVGRLDKHPIGYGMSGKEEFPKDFRYEQGSITPEQHQQIYQRAKQLFNPQSTQDLSQHRMDVFQQAADDVIGKPPEQITQVKGKQNAAPNESYQPYVQDFVKSGNWSDVGDLDNTGLKKVGNKYLNDSEFTEAAKKYGRAGERMDTPWEVSRQRHLDAGISEDEALKNWVEAFKEGRGRFDIPAEGMARGGLSYMGKGGVPKGAKKIMSLADQVRAEMAMEKAGAKAPKRLFSGEGAASDAIVKAAQSAGMNAPVTANKPLTTVQDFHTSIGDEVRRRSIDAKKEMDAFNYKYDKGQRVFTEDSAKKNKAPYEVIERYRHGNNLMWEGEPWTSKKIIDPETGKAKRTPYEPGYRVRGEIGEMILPESAIKGNVDMARGGLAHMAKGGRSVRGAKKVMSLADEVRAEMAAEKLAAPPANVKVEPAYPYQDRLNKVKPVYGARKILPREQADANKAAFLEPSVVKDRLYHGTKRNFTRFSPTTADSIFLTPDPTFASGFAQGSLEFKDPYSQVTIGRFSTPNAKFKEPEEQVDNANILPVRVQVRNPFDYENAEHIDALRDWVVKNTGMPKDRVDRELQVMSDPDNSNNWAPMENPYFQRGIKALGHDAYYTKELDTKNLGVYNPNVVKSDIGNIGTYSTKTPEITEKKGGLV